MRKKIIIILLILVGILLYIGNICDVFNENGIINSIKVDSINVETIADILKSDKDKIIIIDAGHGGKDPGKVGIHNELEKDINLSISFKLKDMLVDNGFSVIMTRTDDSGLYGPDDKNKKNSDLRKRVELINNSDAILVVSIHQNSFIANDQKGAQVFYHESSSISKGVAKSIQDAIKTYHDKDNKRVEKSNKSYYMLKKTIKPIVIVECGFLSNEYDARKLVMPKYQESIAKAINNGIINWANKIMEEK